MYVLKQNLYHTFESCTFENSTSHESGGSIYVHQQNEQFHFKNLHVSKGTARIGAIVIYQDNYFITFLGEIEFQSLHLLHFLIALLLYLDVVLCDNKSLKEASALLLYYSNDFFLMSNCSVARNSAGYGGAVSVFSSNNYISIEGSVFEDNKQYLDGGALTVISSNNYAIIQNCTFDGNSVQTGNGGGLHFSTANRYLQIRNCTISNNKAVGSPDDPFNGGGLYFGSRHYNLVLDNVRILDNSATGIGGGMVLGHSNDHARISNCVFEGNRAILV